jgi:hypothetical protein
MELMAIVSIITIPVAAEKPPMYTMAARVLEEKYKGKPRTYKSGFRPEGCKYA